MCDMQSPLLPQRPLCGQLGEQAGGWQTPAVQTLEPQSPLPPQCMPSLQVGAHAGGWQVPLQLWEAHWLLLVHAVPSGQSTVHAGEESSSTTSAEASTAPSIAESDPPWITSGVASPEGDVASTPVSALPESGLVPSGPPVVPSF